MMVLNTHRTLSLAQFLKHYQKKKLITLTNVTNNNTKLGQHKKETNGGVGISDMT
jgi:hypothetical protein